MENKILGMLLAAGRSSRFKNTKNKILMEFQGKILVRSVAETLGKVADDIIVVVNNDEKTREGVEQALSGINCSYCLQEETLGTAHAVLTGLLNTKNLSDYDSVLVAYADKPLITPATLKSLVDEHFKQDNYLTIAISITNRPLAKGRIVRDDLDSIKEIVEFKNCTPEQKNINEVNSGFMIFKTDKILELFKSINKNEVTNEYYLTDLIKISYLNGLRLGSITIKPEEAYDINTIEEFQTAPILVAA